MRLFGMQWSSESGRTVIGYGQGENHMPFSIVTYNFPETEGAGLVPNGLQMRVSIRDPCPTFQLARCLEFRPSAQ